MDQDIESRILQAAAELFSLKGMRATSVREIADKAECAEVTIFRRYCTKEELILAVLRGKALRSFPIEKITRNYDKPAKEFFTIVANLMYDAHYAEPHLFRLVLFAALEMPEVMRSYYKTIEMYYKAIDHYYQEGIKKGRFHSIDGPDIVSHFFPYMLRSHFINEVLFGQPPMSKEDTIQALVELLTRGIADGPGKP